MTLSVASLYDAIVAQRLQEGDEERLYLDFSGYVTEVVSNSSELLTKLRSYFRDFLADAQTGPANVTITAIEDAAFDPTALGLELTPKTPDPGKTRVKEEYQNFADGRAVHKRLTGMLFLFGGDLHLAVGPCVANDNQVVNFINNRFIEWTLDAGSLLFHAAGVALKKGQSLSGLALAGFAGMGKSTLALRIMSLGATFVSNDRLMVNKHDDGLVMYGVAKMPRINPGTVLHNKDLNAVIPPDERKRFEALPPDELWKLEYKYDAFIDACYGPGRFVLSAPLRGLVLLNWRKPHEEPRQPVTVTQVDLTQRSDLMPAFMKSVGLFYGTSETAVQDEKMAFSAAAYLDMLGNCPVYELTGTADFDAAAKACIDLF